MWTVSLQVEDQDFVFKFNTGAEVTAITKQDYLKLTGVTLQKPTRVLYGPICQTLQVVGQFQATLSSNWTSSLETMYMVCSLRNNLLGLPTISSPIWPTGLSHVQRCLM